MTKTTAIGEQRLHWNKPRPYGADRPEWLVWNSDCGRYRIVRSTGDTENGLNGFATLVRRNERWDILVSLALGPTYARYFKTLAQALDAVLEHLRGQCGGGITHNHSRTLREAEEAGIATTNVIEKRSLTPRRLRVESENIVSDVHNPEEEENDMATATKAKKIEFQRADVVSMLEELKLHTISKRSNAELVKTLMKMPVYVSDNPDDNKPTTEQGEATLAAVLAAVREGEAIAVVGGEEKPARAAKGGKGKDNKAPASNGHTEAAPKGKGKGDKPRAETNGHTPKAPKENAGRGRPAAADNRIPGPGSTIKRKWHDKEYSVKVTADGFVYDGTKYTSLTAVAKAITNYASINGVAFFGLAK